MFFIETLPQKALPYAETHVLSHKWSRSVFWCPVGVSKYTKKQKVTENALPTQALFPSHHINQILHVGSYPQISFWFWVSLKSVEKCGSCEGRNFGLPIVLALHLYNSLLLPQGCYCTSRDKPKFHYADFHWNFPARGKSWTQMMKVADTNGDLSQSRRNGIWVIRVHQRNVTKKILTILRYINKHVEFGWFVIILCFLPTNIRKMHALWTM